MFSTRRIQLKILEYLRSRGRGVSERELYEYIRREVEISWSKFEFLIMALEIEGFVSVRTLKDSRNRIISLREQGSTQRY